VIFKAHPVIVYGLRYFNLIGGGEGQPLVRKACVCGKVTFAFVDGRLFQLAIRRLFGQTVSFRSLINLVQIICENLAVYFCAGNNKSCFLLVAAGTQRKNYNNGKKNGRYTG
jgi:hypothetical protein